MASDTPVCRILSLDGGGAKGFYTLGILRELEAMLPKPIHETFDLIFGTSTGSIIAAMLAAGMKVENIKDHYREHVPVIMRGWFKSSKTAALRKAGAAVFQEKKFDIFKTGIGIVSTRWHEETPMIFKSKQTQAHGLRATFVPGFGCTVADALEASCSAYPFFKRKFVTTSVGDKVELLDGGYCANNPTLYAIADAIAAIGHAPENCRVLSLGCGQYPQPQYWFVKRMIHRFWLVELLQKTLDINTASMDQLRELLYRAVPTVRISETFSEPHLATDLFEYDLKKLNRLEQQGSSSFRKHEAELKQLLLGGKE